MSKLISSLGLGLIGASRAQVLSNPLARFSLHTCKYTTSLTSKDPDTRLRLSRPVKGTFVRNLYSETALGLYKLDRLRESRGKMYASGKERYIERLSNYLDSGDSESVFIDDLITMIALADEDRHLDIIEKLAIKVQPAMESQASSWGSAVMRLCYRMNQIDRAYNNIIDQARFGNFFNQVTSYQVVMTMLYDAGRYQEVIQLYDMAKERVQMEVDTNKNYRLRTLILLAYASHAKLNTPVREALEGAQEILSEDSALTSYIKMRTLCFVAYMALKQDQPTMALNLLASCHGKSYISLRELKSVCLIKLKRYEDLVFHVRQIVESVERDHHVALKDVADMVESKQAEIEDENVRQELMKTMAELKENNLVDHEVTLDAVIFKKIAKAGVLGPVDKFRRVRPYGQQNDRPAGNFKPNSDRLADGTKMSGQRNQRGSNYSQQRRSNRTKSSNKSYFEEDLDDLGEDDLKVDFKSDKRFR